MIRLPWPPSACNPNSRMHHMALARIKAQYRGDCFLLAKVQAKQRSGPLLVTLTFRPPDNRRRDLDNALSSIKAGLDGVADAIGVDDLHWALMLQWGEPVKGGVVEVEIQPAPAPLTDTIPSRHRGNDEP